MNWKKIGKALLFPHGLVVALLVIAAAAALVYGFVALPETAPGRIAGYVLAFYALVVACLAVPGWIAGLRRFRRENRYARRWLGDARLRVNVTLSGNLLWNGGYAALQLGLGIYHRSSWFYTLAGYYFSLAVMRLILVRYTLRHQPGENMCRELKLSGACGWVFLLTNLAMSAMIFYMIYENRMVAHHEIITIAMAAYTFATLTIAIVNLVKYRKYNSPVFTASKLVSLAAACVSMLTLEGTMLSTFGAEGMTPGVQRLFLALSGGGVSILLIVTAVYMIGKANRNINCLEK